jgi:hypothetical protein
MAWSGIAIAEKNAMNLCRYCTNPTTLLTLVTLVVIDHLRMDSVFLGSILISPPPIMYPEYTNEKLAFLKVIRQLVLFQSL